MWNNINKIKRFFRISLWRTLFFNFYMLPFKQAIRIPIILTRNVRFYNLSGKICFSGEVKTATVRFGFFGEDNMYWNSKKTLLKIEGKLYFGSDIHFANGILIRVEKNAVLKIEDNTSISNEVKIICYEFIHIKRNNRIAWETQIIDTTFHFIIDKNNPENIAPLNKPVILGENNWIGNKTNIMKGAETPDFCIIASGSLVNKKINVPNYSLVAGVPVKLIRENVYRALIDEEIQIKTKLNY